MTIDRIILDEINSKDILIDNKNYNNYNFSNYKTKSFPNIKSLKSKELKESIEITPDILYGDEYSYNKLINLSTHVKFINNSSNSVKWIDSTKWIVNNLKNIDWKLIIKTFLMENLKSKFIISMIYDSISLRDSLRNNFGRDSSPKILYVAYRLDIINIIRLVSSILNIIENSKELKTFRIHIIKSLEILKGYREWLKILVQCLNYYKLSQTLNYKIVINDQYIIRYDNDLNNDDNFVELKLKLIDYDYDEEEDNAGFNYDLILLNNAITKDDLKLKKYLMDKNANDLKHLIELKDF
ncbi:hypothetical protein WICMUC_002032 [Wickerhamomyces mucosus]|uniref:Uncharacterized protein n=1 Tax=Wickerhamomyces mucosus TaxID=1378264 RepID=A0A9P8TFF4_9ASCO|nr:hypothetical protein WICMUC_002032 [Wickerhamomyces mucosus]